MLKTLLAELASSPSAIGKLNAYAAQLRRHRRIYLIAACILTVGVGLQTVALLFPPENTSTTSSANILPGGVTSTNELLQYYDTNAHSFRDIVTTLGIAREELTSFTEDTVHIDDQSIINRTPVVGTKNGEQAYVASGFSLYARPAANISLPSRTVEVITGEASSVGAVSFLATSGNIVVPATYTLPDSPLAAPNISIALQRYGEDSPLGNDILQPGDRFVASFTLTNTTNDIIDLPTISYDVSDALEYSTVVDSGNALVRNGHINWTNIVLTPGESTVRTITFRIDDTITTSPAGLGNPLSNDCTISLASQNVVHARVQCAPEKHLELFSRMLPIMPAAASLGITALVTVVSWLLYIRTRVIIARVRDVRHNLNSGAL